MSRIDESSWYQGTVCARSSPSCMLKLSNFAMSRSLDSQCLDLPLDLSLRRRHVAAIVYLSRASGLYPECMVLKGIQFVGEDAIAGGGYGDVWKGLLNGEALAVKVIKVYQRSDLVKLLKVQF